jgi:hypothetical protein
LLEPGVSIDDDVVLNKFIDRVCLEDVPNWKQSYQKSVIPSEYEERNETKRKSKVKTRKRSQHKMLVAKKVGRVDKEYRRPNNKEEMERQDRFRRLVKCFKLLRTIRSVWKAFAEFASEHPNLKISFKFLPKPPTMDKVKSQPLERRLIKWLRLELELLDEKSLQRTDNELVKIAKAMSIKEKATREANNSRKVFTLVEKLSMALDHLRNFGPRAFHCELQLLQIPYFHTKAQDEPKVASNEYQFLEAYFGCSKLSCYTCWEILKAVGHTTRNTHGKLRYNCAFPLMNTSDLTKSEVLACLGKMTKRLITEIMPNLEEVEENPPPSDTATFYQQTDRFESTRDYTNVGDEEISWDLSGLDEEINWDLSDLDEDLSLSEMARLSIPCIPRVRSASEGQVFRDCSPNGSYTSIRTV